jgi:serine/threonine protein kinase
VVRPEFVGRESISRMLATEARVAAALNHPHIVQVFDFGRLGGSYFMAMEWVDGVSLGHVMARMMRERRRVPIAVVAHVITSVAEALAYLGEGVDVDGQVTPLVHRDVSPSNVLLSLAGTVKLSDFGVVKILDESSETKTGVVKGKYAYMSPEQLRGEPVDHRADLFSLGVVLFEMLTMARLFQRKTTAGTIAAVHAARVPPPSSLWPDIPPELDALVLRMLARKREDRFSSAAEVVSALQPFLTHGARGELATEVRALSSAESTRPSLGPAQPLAGGRPAARRQPRRVRGAGGAGGRDLGLRRARRRGRAAHDLGPARAVGARRERGRPGQQDRDAHRRQRARLGAQDRGRRRAHARRCAGGCWRRWRW